MNKWQRIKKFIEAEIQQRRMILEKDNEDINTYDEEARDEFLIAEGAERALLDVLSEIKRYEQMG